MKHQYTRVSSKTEKRKRGDCAGDFARLCQLITYLSLTKPTCARLKSSVFELKASAFLAGGFQHQIVFKCCQPKLRGLPAERGYSRVLI
jgi:hypothetical protein